MKAIIVGCGGVGSFLVPAMAKLLKPENIILVDGDKLEAKNMDRQLFNEEHIGRFKAEALGEKYGCHSVNEWYSMELMAHDPEDWLMGCVDNHPARAAVLAACDFNKCSAIFGANETLSAEAYLYKPDWRASKLDPRVYYPEIIKVTTGDPRAGAIGCTGEAQEENRQLVTANFMAAALMQHLFVAHALEGPRLKEYAIKSLPHRLGSSLSRLGYDTIKQTIGE